MTIPGIGPLISTAMVAAVGKGEAYHRGRDFAAWLGLVPRQNGTGGRAISGRITKRGNCHRRDMVARLVWEGERLRSLAQTCFGTVGFLSDKATFVLGFAFWGDGGKLDPRHDLPSMPPSEPIHQHRVDAEGYHFSLGGFAVAIQAGDAVHASGWFELTLLIFCLAANVRYREAAYQTLRCIMISLRAVVLAKADPWPDAGTF